jgi:imidazolonepropionase-like amidohydrolase
VLAHIFDLADAKGLLRAGVDGFAHGVRDTDIDDEFLAMMQAKPQVFVIPNLPEREIGDDVAWLDGQLPPQELARLRTAASTRTPAAAQAARDLFDVQARNLARLHAAGVTIGFGTDSGVSVGWTAHTELADMVAAGLTPMQALVAATKTSAELLKLDRQGTLAPGKRADFVVLDANPLDDITHSRRIAGVYLDGVAVDRAAIMR